MKKLTFIMVLTIFLVLSCSKDEFDLSSKLESRSTRIVLPTNENGILKFTSIEHAIIYYNYLDSITKESNNSDSLLSKIETSLNFISLRSLDPIVFTDPLEIMLDSENFIGDDIRKSILNANYEFKVDTNIICYQNRDEIYEISENDIFGLSNIRN